MQYVHNFIEEKKDFIQYLQDIVTDSDLEMNVLQQFVTCFYELVEKKFTKDLIKQKQDSTLYLHAISELSKFDAIISEDYLVGRDKLLCSRLLEDTVERDYFSHSLLLSIICSCRFDESNRESRRRLAPLF
jgi:hypothetical protein